MKALLVAAAPSPGSTELVASLAPEHDAVFAVDGGGRVCIEAGVQPTVLLGDFDSLDPAEIDWLREGGSRVMTFPADKDETDTELALTMARTEGAASVTLTAASGRRLDHTLATLAALVAASDLSPVLVEPTVRLWVLHERGCTELHLSEQSAVFSLMPWAGSCVVSTDGVRWPLDHEELSPLAGRGVGNVVSGPAACVELHSGIVLVIAPDLEDTVRLSAQ